MSRDINREIDKDIEFLKAISQTNKDYPTTNPWNKIIPVEHAIRILEKYQIR